MRTLLLAIGSFLPIIGSWAYIVSIYKGKTRPHRMTRFLLLIITALMFGSLWISGDTSGVWLGLASFVQAIVIWAISLKRGIGGTDRLDFVCLGLCVVGLGLWIFTNKPWVGLLASITVDLIACVPSLLKTIRLPHTELMLFFALDTIAGLAIMAAGPYTLQALAFPGYIVAINFVYVVAIWWPRKRSVLSEV